MRRRPGSKRSSGLESVISCNAAARITWDSFSESYLKYNEDSKSRRTYLQFDRPAIAAFNKVAKGYPLSSITTQMIVDWLIGLRKEGYNDTSRRMMFGALSTALNYAVKTKLLAENPMRHATRPVSEESGRELTDAEIGKLFQRAAISFGARVLSQ